MIGVIANSSDHGVVRELFELFKTPWEFYRSDRPYEVVLCAEDSRCRKGSAKLVVTYAGEKTSVDTETNVQVDSQQRDTVLLYKGSRLPIYGNCVTFAHKGLGLLTDSRSQRAATYLAPSRSGVLVRIGYDLFREVRFLLTAGQPLGNANIPSLEIHIAILRDLIVDCTGLLVEIPPVPDGYQFIACLTHDVDHPLVGQHKWDHTMFGFLYRALFGSLVKVLRGQMPARHLLTNWRAATMLPLVHLGLAKDFWSGFDRYVEMDGGLGSTFFVIPFKDYPGRTAHGAAPRMRATGYDAHDIAGHIRKLVSLGCEVGLHGIDAWLDSSDGRKERERVSQISGQPDIGVRMHWLYTNENSPVALERAGFAYDSTSGYNETVGYRAGTTQAFKPPDATRLLELPLHVMDTALFSSGRLGLSPGEARQQVQDILDKASLWGGAVTVNWHDRSIAPERLWNEFYINLIEDLKSRQPWFATAAAAVAWFRKRRSAVFENIRLESGVLRATVCVDDDATLPRLRLRIHKRREPRQFSTIGAQASDSYVDIGVHDRRSHLHCRLSCE